MVFTTKLTSKALANTSGPRRRGWDGHIAGLIREETTAPAPKRVVKPWRMPRMSCQPQSWDEERHILVICCPVCTSFHRSWIYWKERSKILFHLDSNDLMSLFMCFKSVLEILHNSGCVLTTPKYTCANVCVNAKSYSGSETTRPVSVKEGPIRLEVRTPLYKISYCEEWKKKNPR